jgi:hypothetical protein
MTSPAVTVDPDTTLTTVAAKMDTERVKRLPVTDEQGHLVGIVSRSDLLRAYLRDDHAIRDEIREQVLLHTLWIGRARGGFRRGEADDPKSCQRHDMHGRTPQAQCIDDEELHIDEVDDGGSPSRGESHPASPQRHGR